MKTKAFTSSDSVKVSDATQAGFQPDLIYIGTGGTMVIHVLNAGVASDETVIVYDGQWWPADNVQRVNATSTTASSFVAWQQ